jgi:hypothetical protein
MSVPDGGATLMTLGTGRACTQDMQCMSGHCDGVCCDSGDCCSTIADCSTTSVGGIQLACNDPANCQGSGGAIQCMNSRCVAIGGAANDSACLPTTLANNCGAYLPVYCNGTADQQAPPCPTACQSNANCKPNAHCDKVCVLNVDNGGACKKDLDCSSGHCNNGICCGSGDCCRDASQCPASYTSPSTCDAPTMCQGNAKQAKCSNWQCTSNLVMDDSACTAAMIANACGAKADLHCNGKQSQVPPDCGGIVCMNDSQCDPGAYCKLSDSPASCQPKGANATACTANNMCTSNSCGSNHLCCGDTGGQCCSRSADCTDAQYNTKTCDHPETCLGSKQSPMCNGTMCGSVLVPNATDACDGKVNQCGAYAPATCPARCKTSCTVPADCAAGFTCIASACQMAMPLAGAGGAAGMVALP